MWTTEKTRATEAEILREIQSLQRTQRQHNDDEGNGRHRQGDDGSGGRRVEEIILEQELSNDVKFYNNVGDGGGGVGGGGGGGGGAGRMTTTELAARAAVEHPAVRKRPSTAPGVARSTSLAVDVEDGAATSGFGEMTSDVLTDVTGLRQRHVPPPPLSLKSPPPPPQSRGSGGFINQSSSSLVSYDLIAEVDVPRPPREQEQVSDDGGGQREFLGVLGSNTSTGRRVGR